MHNFGNEEGNVVGAISHEIMDWHACTFSTPEAMAIRCLVFELSKLIFKGHNLFDGFLNRLIKYIKDEAGVWWVQSLKI